jgi:tetratricopeptide (TPR) repeat protein
MPYRLVTVPAVMAIAVALVGAQAGPSDDWSRVIAGIEQAAVEGSATSLIRARDDLLRRAPALSVGNRAPLVQYAIAYSAWRMASLSGVPGDERNAVLDDGVARLQTVMNANPQDAEALALLGGLYALQIGRSPLKAIVLGSRISGMLDRAAELAPNNPRVELQVGISAFHTPAAFGGGMNKAERLLRRSLELFSREPLDRPWPNWGRVDAHAWLGQVLARKGDRTGARAEYDTALTLAPNSGWVAHVLLPALERGTRP